MRGVLIQTAVEQMGFEFIVVFEPSTQVFLISEFFASFKSYFSVKFCG